MSQSRTPSGLGRLRDPPRPRTTTSFLKRVMTAPPDPSSLTQQTVSVYKLSWEKLKASFLEKRFPKDKYPTLAFEEQPRTINQDKYVFMVPEPLSTEDHIEIDLLRGENPQAHLEREQSQEP